MQADPKQRGKLREKRAEIQRLDDQARALCALQSDTERTKRVDFHSFRRAYSTALARSGVNAQTAMRLAGHRQMTTHMRYVMAVEVLETPVEALPFAKPWALGVPNSPEVIETEGSEGSEVPVPAHVIKRPHRESNAVEEPTIEPKTSLSVTSDDPADGAAFGPNSAKLGPAVTNRDESIDAVEAALADALTKAAAAGQWETVAQLARELEARRKARAGVVELGTERARRGR